MLLKNEQIAIGGGGPGGLTLVRLLQLKGASVRVYERDFNKTARLMHSKDALAKMLGFFSGH